MMGMRPIATFKDQMIAVKLGMLVNAYEQAFKLNDNKKKENKEESCIDRNPKMGEVDITRLDKTTGIKVNGTMTYDPKKGIVEEMKTKISGTDENGKTQISELKYFKINNPNGGKDEHYSLTEHGKMTELIINGSTGAAFLNEVDPAPKS